MSFFKRVNLDNYRNFDQFSIELDKNCNVLFGKNGSGKTNILESISLCERGSGFRKDKINNFKRLNSEYTYYLYDDNDMDDFVNEYGLHGLFNDNKLLMALNTFKGKLTNHEVAEAHSLSFTSPESV